MIERPRLRAHYHAEVIAEEGLVLLSETDHVVLEGAVFAALAPYLDGQNSVDQIVGRLAGRATRAEVIAALDRLERAGHTGGLVESISAGEAALWASQGIDPRHAARRLAGASVSVRALGAISIEPLIGALQSLSVNVSASGSLEVVVTDDYLRNGLERLNLDALSTGRPWLLVKPLGHEIWLGPIFRPGRAACWECLAQRLRANRPVDTFMRSRNHRREPPAVPRAFSPATLQIAWNLAAAKIAERVVRGDLPELDGQIVTFDIQSLRITSHVVVRQPQCRACGAGIENSGNQVAPVALASRTKSFTDDGGHRVFSPEATLARHAHQVSPITGVVSTLARLGIANDGVLHGYVAEHNFAIRRSGGDQWRKGFRGRSGGKGATDSQARASALCEALERASGLYRGDEPRIKARLDDLGTDAIHPNSCMLFSDWQYRERDQWNARGSRFNFVPIPFEPDAVTEWTPVWSLSRKAARYLPTALCYFNYPAAEDATFCRCSSNGNAGGNTLEEAILQGFLELVERDSVALWWYSRARRPAVDLASFDLPYLHRVSSVLRARQRDLWVLDLTSDLDIPTFAALSRRNGHQSEGLLFGFGAHIDPRIAILRAVTELTQFLFVFRDDRSMKVPEDDQEIDGEFRHWFQTATLESEPYLAPDSRTSPRKASDFRDVSSDDLRDDVLFCQALVEKRGMELLVLDQTRADIGLPVVKVIVPGLRHFWARFAPGRLYEIPIELGWLPQPLAERELNPIPMFI